MPREPSTDDPWVGTLAGTEAASSTRYAEPDRTESDLAGPSPATHQRSTRSEASEARERRTASEHRGMVCDLPATTVSIRTRAQCTSPKHVDRWHFSDTITSSYNEAPSADHGPRVRGTSLAEASARIGVLAAGSSTTAPTGDAHRSAPGLLGSFQPTARGRSGERHHCEGGPPRRGSGR